MARAQNTREFRAIHLQILQNNPFEKYLLMAKHTLLVEFVQNSPCNHKSILSLQWPNQDLPGWASCPLKAPEKKITGILGKNER